MEIAVLGDDSFITGFRLAGIRRLALSGKEKIQEGMESLMKDKDIGIIIVHENDYQKLNPKMKKGLENIPRPIIVRISEKASQDLQRLMKKSFGVDLWKENA